MIVLHVALFAILGTCLVFSIIELGLTAFVVSFFGGTHQEETWDPYSGYSLTDVHYSTPGILSLMLFSAIWSILVSIAAVVLPWTYTRKGVPASRKLNTILGVSFIVTFFVTSVFWLACFADIAAQLGGDVSLSDYLNAMIAFAVLLWLLFLALGILAVLSTCGVLVSDWPGYQSMRKGVAPEQLPASNVPPTATANEQMSTVPTPAPVDVTEPAGHDAEALHHQPGIIPPHNLNAEGPGMNRFELGTESHV
ncbi:Uncharacterized protein PECH_000539 [Penicillium ucsense]|uniref:MARVEL domain-containing protein n=1 Tax=Penicillium ucsense TaxID=2839758 RepID=A0A8J8W0T5_9EURO|nr:Uncharacterized protein PECM_008900 [Penicillium ucsense]KAF7733499.1 Uncharacterized protein PECH_000539 [Penicillium ucsense]